MNIQTLNYRMIGLSPLLHHNPRLADPLNRFTKEIKKISSKRKKTDSDHEEMARLEFLGGLYVDPETGAPAIPIKWILAAMTGRGSLLRERLRSSAKASMAVQPAPGTDFFQLEYDGPKDPFEMWKVTDEDGDRVFANRVPVNVNRGSSKVIRTRPEFPDWEADIVLEFDLDVYNKEEFTEILNETGRRMGIGDHRPQTGGWHGKFEVELVE